MIIVVDSLETRLEYSTYIILSSLMATYSTCSTDSNVDSISFISLSVFFIMPQLERLCTTHAGIMEWDRYCMAGNIRRVLIFVEN